MTEARATYDPGDAALQRATADYLAAVQRVHGPSAVVRVTVEQTLAPATPVASPARLTLVGDEIPIGDAARYLDLSKRTLKRYAAQGRCRLITRNGWHYLDRLEVDRLKREVERR